MAVMEPFATPQDMEDRTQGAITPTSHPFLEQELAAATEAIRAACGWHIATEETVDFVRNGPFPQDVWLPAMRIGQVTYCEVDGRVVDAASVRFDPNTGWTNVRGCSVRIIFIAGFATVPADLVTLTLELAAGGLGTSLSIGREQAGGVAVTYTRPNGSVLASDGPRLAPYAIGPLP